VLTNAKACELTAEFLLVQPDFERIVLPYKNALEQLGVKASVRIVDTSQYQRRHDTFDFDIIVASFPSRFRPATSSAISGARKPPTRKAAAT
jgi:microcin C transport system substrate-binding protein